MTKEELEKIIETDLFQMRGFATRYIDYGKRFVAKEILDEIDVIDAETKALQLQVEQTEKAEFERLKAAHPDQADLVKAFGELLKNIDQSHTNIMNTYKRSKMAELKKKHLGED
jgi:hypothetical protein